MDLLIQQADDEVNEKRALQKKAAEGDDKRIQQNADINLAHAKEVKNIVNVLTPDFRNLVPILKKPMTNAIPPAWKNAEIQAIVDDG